MRVGLKGIVFALASCLAMSSGGNHSAHADNTKSAVAPVIMNPSRAVNGAGQPAPTMIKMPLVSTAQAAQFFATRQVPPSDVPAPTQLPENAVSSDTISSSPSTASSADTQASTPAPVDAGTVGGFKKVLIDPALQTAAQSQGAAGQSAIAPTISIPAQ